MKRLSILLAAATLLAAIAGCQKEPVGGNASETDVYVQFTINFADGAATKADYNSSAVAVGTDEEHAVKYAYLYFFDSTSKKYAKTVKIAGGDVTSTNVESSVVKKTTVPTKLTPSTYNVYATINYEVTGLKDATTEDAFKAMTYVHPYATFKVAGDDGSGIPMSSRAEGGQMSQDNVVVDSYNTFENPVQITLYMERMLAKTTIQTKASNTFNVTTERDGTGTALASVELKSFKPVNLTVNSYLFRHVGTDATSTTFGDITDANYVIDPETAVKIDGTVTSGTHNFYNHVNDAESYTDMPTAGTATTAFYCTENTMLKDNQRQTYATAYAFTGDITPAENTYYYNNGTSVVKGTYDGTADLWYFDGLFFDSLESLNTHKGLSLVDDSTKSNHYKNFGVKHFEGGTCYYTYYIRHFNNNKPQEMGIMEYAIVRNNDYQVTITGISSLGEDVPTVPGEEIEATESYFQATLLVRPWVVRAQEAVLG